MILTVKERLHLIDILPNQGTYINLKVLEELRLGLSYTEEELETWEITSTTKNDVISYKWGMNGEAEIPIGVQATHIIIDALRGLDEAQMLTDDKAPLYEKFVL